jgi:hypothetical protein
MRHIVVAAFSVLTGVFLSYLAGMGEAPESALRVRTPPTAQAAAIVPVTEYDAIGELEAGVSSESSEMLSASAVPPFVSPILMKSAEAAFAEENKDEEWSTRAWREVVETIDLVEGGLSQAQIDCRSSTCRVEMVWGRVVTDEDQYLETIASWEKAVLRTGVFRSGRTEFFPERATSLSYFSTKGLTDTFSSTLPPEIPPEAAESFRQSLLEGAEEIRRRAAEARTAISGTDD